MKLNRLDPVWYRLKVRPPHDVVFPSVTWRLLAPHLASGRPDHWELEAQNLAGGFFVVSERFKTLEWLEHALYVDGFAGRHATLSETILDRMVKLGTAEKLAEPLRKPEHGRGWPWMWP